MSEALKDKSIHQLRAMAQALGAEDIFTKTTNQLIQIIEQKQTHVRKVEIAIPEQNQYDARLMTAIPSRRTNKAEIEEILAPHVALGLKLRFDDERWYMAIGDKTDEGTLRMPLRVVLSCANKLLKK